MLSSVFPDRLVTFNPLGPNSENIKYLFNP